MLGQTGSSYWIFFAAIILMMGWMFYQQFQQNKKRKQMQESLHRGDKVVTSGGLIGTIRDIKDGRITLEVAQGVRVDVVRSSVGGLYQGSDEVKS